MRKLDTRRLTAGAGALGAAAMALAGAGTAAAAPDLTGMVYADAQEQLASAGLTPVVATRLGNKVADDECIVDRVQDSPASADTVMVYLNCYGNVASQYAPGYSSQHPLGRAAKEAQEQAEQEAEAQQQAESEAGVTSEDER